MTLPMRCRDRMTAALTPEEVSQAPELLVLASLDPTPHALGIALIARFQGYSASAVRNANRHCSRRPVR
jgi:hypothetical protein